MIDDRTDFKYITPPTGMIVDGNFLATQSQSSQQSKALMWQDIGYLIEATKERDFLCTCRPNYNPYPFFYNTSIRKQNPINVSKWLYTKYANKGGYPDYAYLGSYLENYDPVWGTPMFLDEDESVEDVIGSGTFVDVTSRTHYNPHNSDPSWSNRENFLAGNEIYQSICAELTGAAREGELSDAHELDPEPIIKLQKNMNKLKKVFYGCYANQGGAASPSQLTIRTRPYLWGVGTSAGIVWKRNDSIEGNPIEIYGQYSNLGFDNGTDTAWSTYSYSHTEPHPISGWYVYETFDGETSLTFQFDNQTKVKAVTLWFLDRTWYAEGPHHELTDDRWILTKVNLTKNGTVRLGDGKTYETWKTSGMTDSRPWAEQMCAFVGHTLTPSIYWQDFFVYSAGVNFAEVTYEPNTMMNLPSENE